jgi:hypothetical protein
MVAGKLMNYKEIIDKYYVLLKGYTTHDIPELSLISKDIIPQKALFFIRFWGWVKLLFWFSGIIGLIIGLILNDIGYFGFVFIIVIGFIPHTIQRNLQFDVFYDPRFAGHVYTAEYASGGQYDVYNALIYYHK